MQERQPVIILIGVVRKPVPAELLSTPVTTTHAYLHITSPLRQWEYTPKNKEMRERRRKREREKEVKRREKEVEKSEKEREREGQNATIDM